MSEAVFFVYLLLVGGITYFASRRTRDISGYVLGNRSLSPYTAAVSAGASDMSAWVMLALPALAYASGSEAAMTMVGLLAGHYLTALLVAPRLHRFSRLLKADTVPAYLCARIGATSGRGVVLRLISALLILVFMTLYVSSGLVAGGKLFSQLLGIDTQLAILLGALVIVLYTQVGGFLAISWTDMLQGMLMLMLLLILPAILLGDAGFGGWQIADGPLLGDANGSVLGWSVILSGLAWGLGYSGMPHVLARYKAVRSAREIPMFRRILTLWIGLAMAMAVLIGILARSFYPEGSSVDAESLVLQLMATHFSPVLAGIALAGIMAAVMSTADSQLLVASVAVSEDLISAQRASVSGKGRLLLSKLVVWIVGLVAVVIALQGNNTILDLVSYAWAGLGASFGPVIILSLFWRDLNYVGAWVGMLTGGISTVVFNQYSLLGLYELLPAFVMGLGATIIASRLSASKVAPDTDTYDRCLATEDA